MKCADCSTQLCQIRQRTELPEGCPMLDRDRQEQAAAIYRDPEIRSFYTDTLTSMAQSFGTMPRIIEAVNFCRLRGYRKIGVAYCSGMLRFGRAVSDIFRKHGFEVCSVGCKLGGFSPEELTGQPIGGRKPRTDPSGAPKPERAICNPVGQAQLLNEAGTEFNVVAGLCVGHDSLFFRYSDAPCTVVVLKDRRFPDQCLPSVQAAQEWEWPQG